MKRGNSKAARELEKLRTRLGEAESLNEQYVTRIQDQSVVVDEARAETVQARSERDAVMRQSRDLSKTIDELSSQIRELKERLHNAELGYARLCGFVDRVHEIDDFSRQPGIERIERPITRQRSDFHFCLNQNHGWDQSCNAAKPRHWTDYGR